MVWAGTLHLAGAPLPGRQHQRHTPSPLPVTRTLFFLVDVVPTRFFLLQVILPFVIGNLWGDALRLHVHCSSLVPPVKNHNMPAGGA